MMHQTLNRQMQFYKNSKFPKTYEPLAILLVFLFLIVSTKSYANPTTYQRAYTLEASNQDFSMRAAGDVNGDGIQDIVIGQNFDNFGNNDGGNVFIYSGIDGELIHNIGRFFYGSIGLEDEEFVSGAGDVDNDGFDDIAVTFFGSSVGIYSGRIISQVSPLKTLNTSRLESTDVGLLYFISEPGFGSAAGDLNGDGYDDIAIETSFFTRSFHSGLNGEQLFEIQERFPIDGESVGDLNGDNLPEFIQGNYANAEVISSIDGSTLFSFEEFTRYDNNAADIGDINGDGLSDLLLGDIVRSGADGSILLDNITYYQEEPREVTDYNSDGVRDILIGNEIYSGVDNSLIRTWPEFEGTSVDALGDVNFDGIPDFLIGNVEGVSQYALETLDTSSSHEGAAYVVSGADGSFIQSGADRLFNTLRGRNDYNYFGSHVSNLGDLNGDGVTDFAVGANTDFVAGPSYVSVYLSEVVPEPSTVSLLVLAVAGPLFFQRRFF